MTREEAIRILASSCIPGSKQTEALETLIPELRESEDEMIRKDIINLIYWLKGNPSLCSQYYKDRYDSILTWLEKQKKQKQEWSESDKQNINLIISYLDSYIKEHNDTYGADECESLKYWLKSLPLNLKKKNEDVAKLCSKEWSEEDEKKIIFLERLIEHNVPDGQYGWVDGMKGGFVTKSEAISMLKSLRPQYHGDVTMTEAYKMGKEAGEASHWKPTEEQMEALNVLNLHGDLSYVGQQNQLISLYNDLKKLM